MSTNLFQTFQRYRSIIDDWSGFCEVAASPLPSCITTNTLKTTPEKLAERLPLRPISWYDGGFRCSAGLRPSRQIPYAAGHYVIQEEAAMLPVLLLDPEPGDLVLDMCAAPGNKTVQMAIRMRSKGLIVANDRNEGRLGILRRSINRLGLYNIGITIRDAVGYPCRPNLFDRILVDVPCSGEGTLRRQSKPFFPTPPRRRALLKHVQHAILTRAYKLCRPGGYIVYATCTFAPEENEAIVDAVLKRYPDRLHLVDARAPGLNTTPGLSEWQGERFHPDMQKTMRLWPHHNDTGGFFAALLKKTGHFDEQFAENEKPGPLDTEDTRLLTALNDRFDLPPDFFDEFDIQRDETGRVYLNAPRCWPESVPPPLQRGLPFARTDRRVPKLKTGAAMLLAPHARRHKLTMTPSEMAAFCERKSFEVSRTRLDHDASQGHVMVEYDGMAIGIGFLRITTTHAYVESLLPRHWNHADLSIIQ